MNNPLYVQPGTPEASLISEKLSARVMGRIGQARSRSAILRASIHGLLMAAALVAFIPALSDLARSAAQSGFIQYLSLVTSDGSYVLAHWNDLLWSIAESMPVLPTAAVLATVLVFVNSLRYGVYYIRTRVWPERAAAAAS